MMAVDQGDIVLRVGVLMRLNLNGDRGLGRLSWGGSLLKGRRLEGG